MNIHTNEALGLDLKNRPDISYIANLIKPGERVLDLGCGYGELMLILKNKGVRVQGIEKDDKCIIQCVKKSLYVHHGDIDDGLKHHLDHSFDFVILNLNINFHFIATSNIAGNSHPIRIFHAPHILGISKMFNYFLRIHNFIFSLSLIRRGLG